MVVAIPKWPGVWQPPSASMAQAAKKYLVAELFPETEMRFASAVIAEVNDTWRVLILTSHGSF